MNELMDWLLLGTFFLYLAASVIFVVAVVGKKVESGEEEHVRRWGKAGIFVTFTGLLAQVAFTVTRIMISGHFPTSNMFEFMAFLSFGIVLFFVVIYYLYRMVVIGAFAMPLAVILLAFASVFPREVEPLIPALQSYWLYIHVTLVALSQGAFSIGFVVGLIYLVRVVGEKPTPKSRFFLEASLVLMMMVVGFIVVSFAFSISDYEATFKYTASTGQTGEEEYRLPAIVGPHEGEVVAADSFLGRDTPLFDAPSWMKGEGAAKKFNSVLWSVFSGLILALITRLIIRKRLYEGLYPMVRGLNPQLVEEISYRANVIGYPLFTLGGLIFAMIWAHEAWGRFWGWDPKENWALITWLFYSVYLHLRLSRDWQGEKSAWLAVIGFIIIMINLLVINLVVAGLHSYA
ncbi:cytochrome c biogenesis protein CcsA [Mechercharimyces sp. CAU 1602]|uniref:cytochrome c biogenesis protein CcsA n=1 Tax=Mechercharimyces sp. CAU 1602 TaxID=2973933 RepID=UPI0021619834|nr:cytochrome c biogenesis protein CcsA [Mechercharimyces sp. CAU 1602]MCS1350930.1 cytochrome c biogenesis protein CcsA [Mechercharimyces sp. CAU 1602]